MTAEGKVLACLQWRELPAALQLGNEIKTTRLRDFGIFFIASTCWNIVLNLASKGRIGFPESIKIHVAGSLLCAGAA